MRSLLLRDVTVVTSAARSLVSNLTRAISKHIHTLGSLVFLGVIMTELDKINSKEHEVIINVIIVGARQRNQSGYWQV